RSRRKPESDGKFISTTTSLQLNALCRRFMPEQHQTKNWQKPYFKLVVGATMQPNPVTDAAFDTNAASFSPLSPNFVNSYGSQRGQHARTRMNTDDFLVFAKSETVELAPISYNPP